MALRQPLFETEHKIIDRRSSAESDQSPVNKPASNPERNAYFGDLHVHTKYSFDAYAFGTLATPYDAYRFAKGEAIKHPSGFDMQLRQQNYSCVAVSVHAIPIFAAQRCSGSKQGGGHRARRGPRRHPRGSQRAFEAG